MVEYCWKRYKTNIDPFEQIKGEISVGNFSFSSGSHSSDLSNKFTRMFHIVYDAAAKVNVHRIPARLLLLSCGGRLTLLNSLKVLPFISLSRCFIVRSPKLVARKFDLANFLFCRTAQIAWFRRLQNQLSLLSEQEIFRWKKVKAEWRLVDAKFLKTKSKFPPVKHSTRGCLCPRLEGYLIPNNKTPLHKLPSEGKSFLLQSFFLLCAIRFQSCVFKQGKVSRCEGVRRATKAVLCCIHLEMIYLRCDDTTARCHDKR